MKSLTIKYEILPLYGNGEWIEAPPSYFMDVIEGFELEDGSFKQKAPQNEAKGR